MTRKEKAAVKIGIKCILLQAQSIEETLQEFTEIPENEITPAQRKVINKYVSLTEAAYTLESMIM